MILYFCKKFGSDVLSCGPSNINNEFVGYGLWGYGLWGYGLWGYGLLFMKDEEQIHTGRPFGGVAVLWRKTLNTYCSTSRSIITYDCDRILGLQLTWGSFIALFLCVYLLCDCSDNHDDYMFYLSKIFQIIDEFQSLAYICMRKF